jgi:predicted acyl esterase
MYGISWGGFNALQMAMRNPPELKAIIATDATEELFHDDIHYIDGMMHVDEFELNMDMAPGMTGAPTTRWMRAFSVRASTRHLVPSVFQASAGWNLLAKSRAAAEWDQGSVLPDWRLSRWLPRQYSAYARASESTDPGADRAVEPFESQ